MLGTAGIMQLGWATTGCQFSNEEGVGDSVDSYAYDGKRVQRWNISCEHYQSAALQQSQNACTAQPNCHNVLESYSIHLM